MLLIYLRDMRHNHAVRLTTIRKGVLFVCLLYSAFLSCALNVQEEIYSVYFGHAINDSDTVAIIDPRLEKVPIDISGLHNDTLISILDTRSLSVSNDGTDGTGSYLYLDTNQSFYSLMVGYKGDDWESVTPDRLIVSVNNSVSLLLETTDGPIRVMKMSGYTSAHTKNGNITVETELGGEFSSEDGTIEIFVHLNDNNDLQFQQLIAETETGDITIRINSSLTINLELKSDHGDVTVSDAVLQNSDESIPRVRCLSDRGDIRVFAQ